jgi:hypothetical protein
MPSNSLHRLNLTPVIERGRSRAFEQRHARHHAGKAEDASRAALGWASILLHRLNSEKVLDEGALTVLADVANALETEG